MTPSYMSSVLQTTQTAGRVANRKRSYGGFNYTYHRPFRKMNVGRRNSAISRPTRIIAGRGRTGIKADLIQS
jgi:hypothetical protein